MKKLIASMFGLSLLALLSLSGDSRMIDVDGVSLQLLTHCGECEKDDDEEDDEDGSVKKSCLLAHCGECEKDDDSGDDEDSLV